MSDQWGGPGWWYASDGKWYPPHGESVSAFDLGDDRLFDSASAGSGDTLTTEALDTDRDTRTRSSIFSVGQDLDEIDVDALEEIDLNALEQSSRSSAPAGFSPVAPAPTPEPRTGLIDLDRPASVTRSTVGPAVRPASDERDVSAAPEPLGAADIPDLPDDSFLGTTHRSVRRESALFAVAVALAAVTGILGALWLRERAAVSELQSEVTATRQLNGPDEAIEELERQNNTLRIANAQLQQQLNDMSALVLELPEGRVTEIDVPLDPAFADEENGRLIAVAADGQYVVFGDGAENAITDSGQVGAAPTGLFAATAKAWISTEAGEIEIVALSENAQLQDGVSFGPVEFLAPEEARGYWTYHEAEGEIVRLRKSDGRITDRVQLPVEVVDLTIGAGSVWALGSDDLVYRINTADLTIQPIEAGDDLVSISAAPDALWTLSARDGALRRIDPVTGAVLVTVPVGRDPIDATFAGSSVWVALRSGSSLIEVDTLTSAVVSRTELPGEPDALYQGETGVYVSTNGAGAQLVRIDSLTSVPEPDAEQATAPAADAETETVAEAETAPAADPSDNS